MPAVTLAHIPTEVLEKELLSRRNQDKTNQEVLTVQLGVANSGLEMKYFVLKPKGNDLYAKASRAALRRYAKLIRLENSALARDLESWADHEFIKYFESSENESLKEHARNQEI